MCSWQLALRGESWWHNEVVVRVCAWWQISPKFPPALPALACPGRGNCLRAARRGARPMGAPAGRPKPFSPAGKS